MNYFWPKEAWNKKKVQRCPEIDWPLKIATTKNMKYLLQNIFVFCDFFPWKVALKLIPTNSNVSMYVVVFSSKLAWLWTNYWQRIFLKMVNVIGGHLKHQNIMGSQTCSKALICAFLTSPKLHETEQNSWWWYIFQISDTDQIVYATVCEVLWIFHAIKWVAFV